MGYPERLLSPGETIVSQFRPHWSRLLREGLLTVLGLVLVILVAIQDWDIKEWIIVALAVAWFLLIIGQVVRYLVTQHVITNERLIYRTGFIAKRGKEIPLEVINDVAFQQTIFERVFGTGDLLIESAGTHGQSRYSDIPAPEEVQSLIYQVREDRTRELEGTAEGPRPGDTTASQLDTLSRLHDQGKLTDEEFEAEKQRLLGGD